MTSLALAGEVGLTARRIDSARGYSRRPVLELDDLIARTESYLASAMAGDGAQRKSSLLDAFLCTAAICQVVADHVHRDIGDLRRVSRYASRMPWPAGAVARVALLGSGIAAHRLQAPRARPVERWLAQVEDFTSRLADAVWSGDALVDVEALNGGWSRIALRPAGVPGHLIAIPPRSFSTFDQRPEDCFELARRFAGEHSDRRRPLVVIGIRTSGCFLAPIVAAALHSLGFEDVRWISWRPGQPRLGRDRAALARAARDRARILVTDDPPTSGGSYGRVASELVAAGVRRENITLLLQLFPGMRQWEKRLTGWQSVILEWSGWDIHRRLRDDQVAKDLNELLAGGQVLERGARGGQRRLRIVGVEAVRSLRPGQTGEQSTRKHVRAIFSARLRAHDGTLLQRDVFVHGIGLGRFGAEVAAIRHRIGAWVPDVYGDRDGLMYRESIAEQLRVDESEPRQREALAADIGRYAAQRAAALPVLADYSLRLSGHDATWEQASRWFGVGFGRLALPMRFLLHACGRSLLEAAKPSLIDGLMGPGRWFRDRGALLKTAWDEGAFTYQLPFCFDAAYDVAAAAAERLPDRNFGTISRAEFEAASGERIDDVRWFLYQVLSQIDRRAGALRQSADTSGAQPVVEWATEGERRVAALHRGFLCDQYLHDTKPPAAGQIAALDIDGVLESTYSWYSAPGAAAVLAVRALAAHGFRTVIATGRSLGEASERCDDYRLAGAVAEYGSVIYDAAQGQTTVLISSESQHDLQTLRQSLAQIAGVELDRAFRYSVRAFTLREGRRRAIPDDVAQELLSRSGLTGRVRMVQGWAQTDFIAEQVDKGTGLRALAGRLGVNSDLPLALAVGDSATDIPMMEPAAVRAAPSNAHHDLVGSMGVKRCRHPYGRGLAEAVGMVIGHAPGSCPKCAVSEPGGRDARLLLALLEVGQSRGPAKLGAIARVMRASRLRGAAVSPR